MLIPWASWVPPPSRGLAACLAILCACDVVVIYSPIGMDNDSGVGGTGATEPQYAFYPTAAISWGGSTMTVVGPNIQQVVQISVGASQCSLLHLEVIDGTLALRCPIPPYTFVEANATVSEEVDVTLWIDSGDAVDAIVLEKPLVFYQPGFLDHTFGDGGIVLLGDAGKRQVLYDAVINSDGSIVAAAAVDNDNNCNESIVALKLDVDGNLDQAFGDGGFVKASCGTTAHAVAASGDYLLAGGTTGNPDGNRNVMWVSSAGSITASANLLDGGVRRMVKTADGDFLSAGFMSRDDNSGTFVARVGADLALDTGYGEAEDLGIVYRNAGSSRTRIGAILELVDTTSLLLWSRDSSTYMTYMLSGSDGRSLQSGSLGPAGDQGQLLDAMLVAWAPSFVAVGEHQGQFFVGRYAQSGLALEANATLTFGEGVRGWALGVAPATANPSYAQVVGVDSAGLVVRAHFQVYGSILPLWVVRTDVTAQNDACLKVVNEPGSMAGHSTADRGVCVGVAGADQNPLDDATTGYFLVMRYWL